MKNFCQAYHGLLAGWQLPKNNMGYELRCIREYLAESFTPKGQGGEAQARHPVVLLVQLRDEPTVLATISPEVLSAMKKERQHGLLRQCVERYD